MSSGFKINRRGIAQMTREIQKEFDKNPVRIPVRQDLRGRSGNPFHQPVTPASITNYNGPVVNSTGDGVRIAIAGEGAVIDQSCVDSPAVDDLRIQAITALLERIETLHLDREDEEALRETAEEVLAELQSSSPNDGKTRRLMASVRGFLQPILDQSRDGLAGDIRQFVSETVQAMIA